MRRLTPFAAALSLTLAVALPAVAQTPPPAAAAPSAAWFRPR